MTSLLSTTPAGSARRRRGMVLVLALWLVLVMSVIAYSLAYETRINMRMTTHARRQAIARGIARAGLAQAVNDLRNDRLLGIANQGILIDTLNDVWARTEDKTDVATGGGVYTVRVIDEDSKIDLNSLQIQSIPLLQTMLEEVCGMKKKEVIQTVANAILDYRDPDFAPMFGEGDSEMDYYTEWGLKNLRRQVPEDWVFKPKNDKFFSLDELMEIPGITREMVYGEAGMTSSDPIDRIDSEEPTFALSDFLTVNGSGRVNINTCSVRLLELALMAATGGDRDAKRMAREIDDLRLRGKHLLKDQEPGITDVSQLSEAGISAEIIQKMSALVPLGAASRSFTIVSRGEYEGVRKTLVVQVQVDVSSYRIQPREPETYGMRDHRCYGYLKDRPDQIIDPEVRVIRQREM